MKKFKKIQLEIIGMFAQNLGYWNIYCDLPLIYIHFYAYYITGYKLEDSLKCYLQPKYIDICAVKPIMLPVIWPNTAGYCIC